MNDYRWEMRLKNLLWTVSGDYELEVSFEDSKWEETPWAALYDAVKEGAYARYFRSERGSDPLSLYLLKKLYLGAEEAPLLAAARLCVDSAVGQRVCLERPGAAEIRRRAYEELLEESFEGLVKHPIGRLQLLWMRAMTGGSSLAETGRWRNCSRKRCARRESFLSRR